MAAGKRFPHIVRMTADGRSISFGARGLTTGLLRKMRRDHFPEALNVLVEVDEDLREQVLARPAFVPASQVDASATLGRIEDFIIKVRPHA